MSMRMAINMMVSLEVTKKMELVKSFSIPLKSFTKGTSKMI